MDADITDPSDWLSTPLSSLSTLDSLLRCRICRDLYTAPMVTECAHSFCSLCIRKCIAATPASEHPCCPICRAAVTEVKLRRNQVVEEVVGWFRTGAREGLLRVAREGEQKRKRVRVDEQQDEKTVETSSSSAAAATEVRRSTRARPTASYQEIPPSPEPTTDSTYVNLDDDDDGLVPCPICDKRMTVKQVTRHIDSCLSLKAKSSSTTSSSTSASTKPKTLLASSSTTPPHQKRLPKIQYSMLSELKLRQKLQDLKIPSHGNKQTLQARHSEWVSIWNANVDRSVPRSKTQLLRELAAWEDSLDRFAAGAKVTAEGLEEWGVKHKGDFRELIAQARRNLPKKAEAKAEVEVEVEAEAEVDKAAE